MNEFDALRGITRRAIPINYTSPLICMNDVPFSASGTGDLSLLDILPTLQKAGTVLSASQSTPGTIRLEWQLLSYAFSYVVYFSTVEGGPFSILTAGVVENFFEYTPGAPGSFFIKVTAIEDEFGETIASNIVTETVV